MTLWDDPDYGSQDIHLSAEEVLRERILHAQKGIENLAQAADSAEEAKRLETIIEESKKKLLEMGLTI